MHKDIAKIVKSIQSFSSMNCYDVFGDFVELAALSTAKPFNNNQRWVSEQVRCIEQKYGVDGVKRLGYIFGMLILSMEKYIKQGKYVDILAQVFMNLEIHSKKAGQFFTPANIASLAAEIAFDEQLVRETIARKGYIILNEPAAGGGVMILAFAEAMKSAGFDPSKQLLIHAVDVDMRCACMNYIHLAYYGLPAVVCHGDALSANAWRVWYTPTYVMDSWCLRDRRRWNVI